MAGVRGAGARDRRVLIVEDLDDAIAALRAEGEDVPNDHVAHLSPITWEHVNFLGQYTFTPEAARALDDRRALRGGADEDGLDETPIP